MKNKKLLALLVSVLALSGCVDPQTSPTPTPTPTPTPSESSTPEESTTPEESSTPSVVVQHQDPLVRDLAEGGGTRKYKAEFDTMVDDFSGDTLLGTNDKGVVQKDTLRVLVDSANDDFPSTPDAAIYKMATGSIDIDKYEGIGFKIRKVGEGTLDLSNLVLALRGADSCKVFEFNLSEAVDPDGEALPELSGEYQDLVVCPNLSLEDDQTVYKNLDGTDSELKVLDEILGFHLYAQGEVSQLIEIEEVFLMTAGEKTILDNFDREKVGDKGGVDVWWRDTTGFIVQSGIKLDDGASYQTAAFADPAANVVLNVMGDTSGVTIAPVTSAGVGTPVAWSALKDQNNVAVASAVNGGFYPIVINFANSGISTEGLIGLKIASTTEVNISTIFLTDLVDRAAVTEYPIIDSKNISMIDNFNRTQSGFDGDYDKSVANQDVIDAGLNYALSYSNGDKVSVANGVVTFDATSIGDGYIQLKEGSNAYDGHQYLVLSVKGEGGASLDGFRIDVGNGAVWSNSWYSAFGLKVPALGAADYPYTTADGFQWLVIDLEESGMDPAAKTDQSLDMYYSGTGKLMIDAAFYADAPGVRVEMEEVKFVDDKVVADQSTYAYVGGYDNTTGKLLKLELSSTAGTTLESLRVQLGDEFKWFKDGVLKDEEGNVIAGDTAVTSEGLTVIVDLEKSGFTTLEGALHVHSGDVAGMTQDITIDASVIQPKAVTVEYSEVTFVTDKVVADQSTYAYVGGYDNTTGKLLKLELSSTAGTTLESLRVQLGDEFKWFKDGVLKDEEGNVIAGDTAVTSEGLTVIVDLEKSGFTTLEGALHVHSGDVAGMTQDITIKATVLEPKVEAPKYEEVTFADDIVVADQSAYAYVGGYDNTTEKLLKLELSSTAGTTLESLRVQLGDEFKWFKDGALKDEEGNVIAADTAVTSEGLTVIVDLEKSGFTTLEGALHVHSGDVAGMTQDITIKATAMKVVEDNSKYEEVMNDFVQE